MAKTSPKQIVYGYYMSMHLGICAAGDSVNPVKLKGMHYGEKNFWRGDLADVSGATRVDDSMLDLFGGLSKEGGVAGYLFYLPGKGDQTIETFLATKLGKTTETCPGFRGLASVFLAQGRHDTPGFYIGTQPYVKDFWATVERKSPGMDPDLALISRPTSITGTAVELRWAQGSGVGFGVYDKATMAIAFFDQGGDQVGDTIMADEIAVETWTTRSIAGTVPDGAYSIRIYMIMDWNLGFVNEAAIDNIEFYFNGLRANLTNADAETGDVSGWTAGAPAGVPFARSLPTADNVNPTPYEGSYSFKGGTFGSHIGAYQEINLGEVDANPANIIYDCLTNKAWGMGAPESILDMTSFSYAQSQLFGEGFGLSMIWTRQATIESFVAEVLDHIQATIFLHPRTGKITLKLIRDDYDPDTIPVITPDNATLSNLQRKGFGEIVNEIQVTWTNPINEQDEVVIAQDLGSMAVQGEVISNSRNYYGIRSAALAMRTAQRDLRAAAYPIASCDAEIDRSLYDVYPGDVVKIVWPEEGIESLIMRVGPVDYGSPGKSAIKLQLMEDSFAFALAEYDDPITSGWENPANAPSVIDYTKVLTAPYFLAFEAVSGDVGEYPEVVSVVLGSDAASDCLGFELYAEQPDAGGVLAFQSEGDRGNVGRALLSGALNAEVTSAAVTFTGKTGNTSPTDGGFALIGADADDETACELCLVTAYDPLTGEMDLTRGVLDTVPHNWPDGTPVWFFEADNSLYDSVVRSDGETATYKLLTRTSLGRLSEAAAPEVDYTLTGRPWYPSRPANVTVEGVAFQAPGDLLDARDNGFTYIVVDWVERNRLTEDTVVLAWDDATVTPEAGQTVTIQVLDPADRSVVGAVTGLTGPGPYNFGKAEFGSLTVGIVRVIAERDGFESLQALEFLVQVNDVTFDSTTITFDSSSVTWDSD